MLTVIPPAMLKKMLHAASLRSLVREAAAKAKVDCPRLCFDVVRNRLRPSKVSNLGKGCIRSLACEALWTYDGAEKSGYQVSNVCALCGQQGDTAFHRLWSCPSVASLREELVEPGILRMAADAVMSDPSTTCSSTGASSHILETPSPVLHVKGGAFRLRCFGTNSPPGRWHNCR